MKSGDILSSRYRIEQEIGKGAMGAVWAAYDHSSNRRVALKTILPQSKEHLTMDLRQRLLREARACGKLWHRNIVQIFDVGETPEGEPFLVLELLHGQTLAERLKEKRRIEPAMAARIAGEVASGLAVAHAAQVIHRDLKPANIFLHREESMPEDTFVSKVLDFGVCKTLDSVDSVATQTGTAVGSPAYMSPEQVGMRKDLDHRTDLWSLGIVLFEMLTGARPFSGSMQDVIRNILLTPVPPPSSKVRGVPPELDAVVARCTAAKREDRYASAEELSAALFAIAQTARPMSRKATFTGIGPPVSGQPLSGPEHPGAFAPMGLSAPSLSATPRAATGSTPEVDESELVATMPLQSRMLMDMRRTSTHAAPREMPSSGAEVPPPNTTLAYPAPAWNKNEMQQALAAHRQSSAYIEVPVPQQAAGGHTPSMRDSQMQRVPGPDPVGTTSGAGALSQDQSGYPAPPMPLMPMGTALGAGKRKKVKGMLVAVMGAGIGLTVGVIGLFVLSANVTMDAQQSENEAKPAGRLAVGPPTEPEVAAPTVTSPPPTPPTAAPTASPSALETAAPAVTAPPAPSATPTLAPQAPLAKATSQAPHVKPTSQAPQPKPAFQVPQAKPTGQHVTPPHTPRCTGSGLTKKCT